MASESRAHSVRLGGCVVARAGFLRPGTGDGAGDAATAEGGAAGSESTDTTNEHVVQSGNAEEAPVATGRVGLLVAADAAMAGECAPVAESCPRERTAARPTPDSRIVVMTNA
ncbi:MAG TPA: hypothetical protein VGY54_21040, partial [Polyangiaceae bacterium]|nr:hypothetical protein [Polyangiaceae bacterium]